MKYLVKLTLLFFGFMACQPFDEIVSADVIENLEVTGSNSTVPADGSCCLEVIATLNSDIEVKDRGVTFMTSSGIFQSSMKQEATIIAEFDTLDGLLKAKALWTRPLVADTVTITAEIKNANVEERLFRSQSFQTTQVIPDAIVVTANSLSIQEGYGSEVTVTGTLSFEGGAVSTGSTVKFFDYYLDTDGTTPVFIEDGRFRNESSSSDAQSKVSAIYSQGEIGADTVIYLGIYVVSDSSIVGSVPINVKQ